MCICMCVCVQALVFSCVTAGTLMPQCLCGSHRTTLGSDPPYPCCLGQGFLFFTSVDARLAPLQAPRISPVSHLNVL